MGETFNTLAIVMGLSAVAGVAAKKLGVPAILGYVAAGFVLTWINPGGGLSGIVPVLGSLGVTLLLFLAGMELPVAELAKLGKVSLITGLGQILITATAGFLLCLGLGFAFEPAIILGIGLTFGSTIMVVKLLSEKGDLQSLHGKIAVGYLLVQDFVAMGLFVAMAGIRGGDGSSSSLLLVAVKGVVLVAGAVWLSGRLVKRVANSLASSTELLFICSIGWCLVVAAAVGSKWVGFTVEIGGFLAGLTLASSLEQGQIISRVRPLRDFFLTWFFVALGAGIHFGSLGRVAILAVVLSIFVLVINPVIVMGILGGLGYRRRTAFMASLAVAQVSEFSLILVAAAVAAGEVVPDVLSLITMVAVVTMTISAYMMYHSDWVYRHGGGTIAGWFERKRKGPGEEAGEKLAGHIVLFGHNRVGGIIRPVLSKIGRKVVVVDFNPEIVEELSQQGEKAVYGDLGDHELYEQLGLADAAMVISTVPDLRDELLFLDELAQLVKHKPGSKPILVLTASDEEGAKKLYEKGADYVLVPHRVGGEYLAALLSGKLAGASPKLVLTNK